MSEPREKLLVESLHLRWTNRIGGAFAVLMLIGVSVMEFTNDDVQSWTESFEVWLMGIPSRYPGQLTVALLALAAGIVGAILGFGIDFAIAVVRHDRESG